MELPGAPYFQDYPVLRLKQHKKKDSASAILLAARKQRPSRSSAKQIQHNKDSPVIPPVSVRNLLLQSPDVYRDALFPFLLASYLPKGTHSARSAKSLLRWMEPRSPSAQAAVDATGLMHVAIVAKDKRVLIAAIERHLSAVRGLQVEFNRPEVSLEAMNSTAQCIMVVELYNLTSLGVPDYSKHIKGILALVDDTEKKVEDEGFQHFLCKTLRTFGAVHGLITRRASELNKMKSKLMPPEIIPGDFEDLLRISLHIPTLLQAVDSIKKSPDRPIQVFTGTLNHLYRIEADLNRWREASVDLNGWQLPFRMPTKLYEPPCAVPAGFQDIFPRMFSYDCSVQACSDGQYWSCLLLVKESILDLAPSAQLSEEDQQRYTMEAEECVNALCCTIPFLMANAESAVCRAMMTRSLVYFITRWYKRTNAAKSLAWCTVVEAYIRCEVPFLHWGSLLPWSLFTVPWLTS